MTSENVDQTFISKQFDFLNDEVCTRELSEDLQRFVGFRIRSMKCFPLQPMDTISAMKTMDQ